MLFIHLLSLQSEPVSAEFHELTSDLSTMLDILPDLDLADDVKDLIALLRRHCRNSSPAIDPSEENLRNKILFLISDVEKEIVPDSSRLQEIFRRLGLEDSRSCRDEIEILEREIGERAPEKWAPAMIASVGLVRYAKCVLFGASTPRPESDIDFPPAGTSDIAVPSDFRCPISLDLMRDPVVVATGQTYDRESIARWIASGHATCPKTEVALVCVENADVAEAAAALVAAIAKRGGAREVGEKEGAVAKLVGVMRSGSDAGRENAASALVYLCRKTAGGKVVSELVGVPGVEWVIWEMMGSGTERGRRKAAAIGRICRRWVAAATEEAERMIAMFSDVNLTAVTVTMAQS